MNDAIKAAADEHATAADAARALALTIPGFRDGDEGERSDLLPGAPTLAAARVAFVVFNTGAADVFGEPDPLNEEFDPAPLLGTLLAASDAAAEVRRNVLDWTSEPGLTVAEAHARWDEVYPATQAESTIDDALHALRSAFVAFPGLSARELITAAAPRVRKGVSLALSLSWSLTEVGCEAWATRVDECTAQMWNQLADMAEDARPA